MFVLSPRTAAELQRLIGERPGNSTTGASGGSSTRQTCYVECVSWDTGDIKGTCTVAERNAYAGAWTDFGDDTDTILLSANGNTLTVGGRYLAIRYGLANTGETVFVAYAESRISLVRCGDWVATPDGCYQVYSGTALILDTQAWTTGAEAIGGDVRLTALDCSTLTPGTAYFGILTGYHSTYPLFLAVGEVFGSSSSGSGNGVCVLTDVYCDGGGVSGETKKLTGHVTIGGKQYPVTFALGDGCGGTSGGA